MNTESFAHDVFLSHSAKDKAVARSLAERLREDGQLLKPERSRRKAGILHSAFILRPFLNSSLAQFRYINWRPADREQEVAKLPTTTWKYGLYVRLNLHPHS